MGVNKKTENRPYSPKNCKKNDELKKKGRFFSRSPFKKMGAQKNTIMGG